MRTVLLLAAVLAATLAGCTGDTSTDDPEGPTEGPDDGTGSATPTPSPSPSPSRQPQTHHVRVEGFAFQPDDLDVWVGDTVVWTNQDGAAHTVDSSDGGPLDSGTLQQGDSYSFTFDAIGRYEYVCDFHSSMTGAVQVFVE